MYDVCEIAPCKQLACQHLCISTGTSTAQCTCYDGYYLATDQTQCIGKIYIASLMRFSEVSNSIHIMRLY